MSNISFLTTRKHIKSYDIPALLQKINEKRFGGKLTITTGYGVGGVSLNDCDSFEFYQHSAKKIGAKSPHNPWMEYVCVVVRNELGAMTNAVLSDEDEGLGTWKPNPKKYSSYKKWVSLFYQSIATLDPRRFEEIVKDELARAPQGMEKY
jgi:hypothetical protein